MISLTGMILKMRYCVVEEIGSGERDICTLPGIWSLKLLGSEGTSHLQKKGSKAFAFCWNILLFQGWWTILRQKKPAIL